MLSRLGRAGAGSCSPRAQLAEWGALAAALGRRRRSGFRSRAGPPAPHAGSRPARWICSWPRRRRRSPSSGGRRWGPRLVAAVFLAWPESWEDGESLAPLMQDLAKDAQRIVFTAAPERAAELVERYARRALTVGAPPPETARPRRRARCEPSRVLLGTSGAQRWPTWWRSWIPPRSRCGRRTARATATSPARCRRATRRSGSSPATRPRPRWWSRSTCRRRSGCGSCSPPARSCCWCRPAPRPTWSGSPRRAGRCACPALVDAIAAEAAARRAPIVRAIEERRPDAALLTLAPLFERYDPAAVAAAVYELWTTAAAAPATPPLPEHPGARPRSTWGSARRTAPP